MTFPIDTLVDTPAAPDPADDPTVTAMDDVPEHAVAAYVWDAYGIRDDVARMFARWFCDSIEDRVDSLGDDQTITWRELLEGAMEEWRGTPPPRSSDPLVARLSVLVAHGVLYGAQPVPTLGDAPPRVQTPDGTVVPTPTEWAAVCDRVADLVAQAEDTPRAGTS